MTPSLYYRPKRYRPVLVAQEGSALWGNTLTTALLHDLNRTILCLHDVPSLSLTLRFLARLGPLFVIQGIPIQ